MTDNNFDFEFNVDELAASNLLEEEQLLALVEYEQDLKVYSAQKNKALRDAIEKKIVEKYRPLLGFGSTDVKSHAALLSLPDDNEDAEKTYTLKDLLELQDNLPSWLVPNLIGAGGGLYIVAGAPKTGKTLLFTYQLAFSVALTGEFLGYPVQKGPVLIYECEESVSKVARTFRSKGLSKFNQMIDYAQHENSIIVKTNFAIDADLPSLKETVKEFQPSLIIFDSLRAITKHLDVSENSSDFSKYLYTLQKTLNFLQVPGLIIHHMSKNAKERGIEGVAGSLSLAGASDGVIMLYRNEKDKSSHSIELATVPREGLPVHWIITRTKPKSGYWSYQISEDKGVDPDQLRMERRVLRFMSSNPGIMYTRLELAQALQQDPDNYTFQNAVNRLIDSLQIAEEQKEDGSFAVWINAGSPWSNLVSDSFHHSVDFDDADKLASVSSKAELQAVTSEWSEDQKTRVWSLLSESEQGHVKQVLNPPAFELQSWVRTKVNLEKESERELHQIASREYDSKENIWYYTVEGNRKFAESELEIALDYSGMDYDEQF